MFVNILIKGDLVHVVYKIKISFLLKLGFNLATNTKAFWVKVLKNKYNILGPYLSLYIGVIALMCRSLLLVFGMILKGVLFGLFGMVCWATSGMTVGYIIWAL